MKYLNNIILAITFIGIIVLFFRLEEKHAQKEAYIKHIDSVLMRTDSLLNEAQKQIDSTNTMIQEIQFYL